MPDDKNNPDELAVDHDALISQIEARKREQHARSSDASESAAEVSKFIEETGLNTQAFSWASTIVKKLDKKDGQAKAMDIIRSLQHVLPMVESHVQGQGTQEMDLGGDDTSGDGEEAELEDQGGDDPVEDAGEGTVTPINFAGNAK